MDAENICEFFRQFELYHNAIMYYLCDHVMLQLKYDWIRRLLQAIIEFPLYTSCVVHQSTNNNQ